MLLPDKHITLAESILGLGAVLLEKLDRPLSVDRLNEAAQAAIASGELPAHHDLDNVLLGITFLYAIGAVEVTGSGGVKRCVS